MANASAGSRQPDPRHFPAPGSRYFPTSGDARKRRRSRVPGAPLWPVHSELLIRRYANDRRHPSGCRAKATRHAADASSPVRVRAPELKLFDPYPSALETDSFQDLLIHQLLAETDEIISRGLHRRYVPRSARLTSPRGRIDLAALARDGFVSSALPCNFHPRNEDCLLNRVLLFGLRQAARMATDCELRHRARRTARILEQDVSDVHVDWATLARLRREMNRLTTAYEPALAILEILLGSIGTSLNPSSRDTECWSGSLFDMNRFFQTLLGRFLTQYLADHQVTEQASIHGLFEYSAKQNPKRRRSPTPRPDYCVRTPDGRILLTDAKYRDLWEQELPREMLYQLALYAMSQKPVGRSTILVLNPGT